MAKSLLIVESPAKARTLKGYLGNEFRVEASVGHVKDLPKSELGVDVDDFTPHYGVIRGKGKVLQELKKAAQEADVIYLAPDPDREGEAIAWHIAEEIAPKKTQKPIYRVMIHEITKSGVKEALSHPGKLDEDRYNAQQARRILDRLVGYQISPILWDKVRRGLSAGRVQSVALRLVADRERQVKAFVSEEYWTIGAELEGRNPPPFTAKLRKTGGKDPKLKTGAEAEALRAAAAGEPFVLKTVERKEKKRHPAPPFITSTLQRDAFRKHRFSARKTMTLAQRLYEGVDIEGQPVGLITYMRTDSTRLSEGALAACREHIRDVYGAAYLPASAVHYKVKKGAQDAHEAIRPSSMEHTPERCKPYLEADQYRLYKLIWDRFVACQMKPALYDQTTFDIEAGTHLFRSTGSILKFKGFMAVYVEGVDEPEEEGEEGAALPDLEAGETLKLLKVTADQHFTQPPPRFTESTLVKELEEQGIGRPSTYAQILSTLRDKGYVEMVERRFVPTDLGILVNDLLVVNFPEVLDVGFTAQMEAALDGVEEGKRPWRDLLKSFYGPFSATLERASRDMVNVKTREEPTDVPCPRCEKTMVIRWGRNGFFLACSGYPECRTTKEFERGPDGTIRIIEGELLGEACPDCGSDLMIKKGRFGRFVACARYPECRYTRAVGTGVPCPRENCGGELVEKRSKRGRTFYACNRYPGCDYAQWDRPIARECPQCGNPFLVEKVGKQGTTVRCPRKGCGYKEEAEG
ncbi:MAG: type I DNA topoisomerase [Deltaproteobacteria bacterium]|nr:type I DNA topoisomerase [Deltaproteobacteria bacterium]